MTTLDARDVRCRKRGGKNMGVGEGKNTRLRRFVQVNPQINRARNAKENQFNGVIGTEAI